MNKKLTFALQSTFYKTLTSNLYFLYISSMQVTPQQVLEMLKKQQYFPIYFLHGEEPYYIDFIADYIETNLLSESEKCFNQTILYGKEHSISRVISEAKQFPVGAERKLIIIKEAQDLQDFHRDTGQDILINYIKKPISTSIVVFCYKYKTLSNKTSLSKTLLEYAIVVPAKKLYENQIPTWISNYVTERGRNITEKSIYMLQESIGSDLNRLAKEIDKVILNLQEGEKITDNILQEYIGISKQFNAFELQNAIGLRDVYKTNFIVFHLIGNTKNEVTIPFIALLATFFSKLLLLHQAKDKSSQALANSLQVNAYFIPQYIAASKKYDVPKIIQNINYLHEADMQLKGVGSYSSSEQDILKELVFKLLH